jgi:hypothetical protein
MADSSRRFQPLFWRDSKHPPVTASAQRIDTSSAKAVQNVLNLRQEWQQQAINDIRAIGQLSYGISIPAALSSRVTLYAAMSPDELDSSPVRLDGSDLDEELVISTIERLGNVVSRSDLQYDLAFNLLATGEAFLICIGPRDNLPERWEIRGIFEVEKSNKTIKTFDTVTNQTITLDQEGDTFIRVWRPDPFDHGKAVSHVRAILGSAEELLWWQWAGAAAAKNRLMLAGMVGFPSNIEAPSESDDDVRLSGSQRWVNKVLKVMGTAIQNPASPDAAVPLVYSYPWNETGKSGVDKTEWERPQDDLLEARTARCLQDIEQGLNLPVGVISGLGGGTHWSGDQVEEATFRDHVEPLIVLMCSALNRAFLQPILAESNITNPERFFIWYDASNLIVHRDKAANSLRSVELGLIGPPAARRELGYSEHDAPTEEERAAMLEWLQSVRRGSSQQGIVDNPSDPNAVPTDPNAAPQRNAPGDRTPAPQRAAPLRGKGQDPVAASFSNGEADSFLAKLQVLCDEKCRRALEYAGNRLRNRAKKVPAYRSAINRVSAMEVASTLGREAVVKLGIDDLFIDAFEGLHTRVLSLVPPTVLAIDTTRPINVLAADLRVICAEHLFKVPGPEPIVPLEVVEKVLQSLDQSAMSA